VAKAAKLDDGSDSGGGWPGFFTYLNQTFDLVRDVFGYALPGGVFFAIGILSGRFNLQDVDKLLSPPYQPPAWAAVGVALAACYAMGHILAALAYLVPDLLKIVFHLCKRDGWVKKFHTEVTPKMLEIRRRHPDFFVSIDRRETMALTTGGVGMAMLLGFIVFYWHRPLPQRLFFNDGKLFLWGGLFILFEFGTAFFHLIRVREAIVEADDDTHTELAAGEFERAVLGLLKKGVPEKDGSENVGSALATQQDSTVGQEVLELVRWISTKRRPGPLDKVEKS
jgi:hypothetical protein